MGNSQEAIDDKRTMAQKIAAFAISEKGLVYKLSHSKHILYAIAEISNYENGCVLPISEIMEQTGFCEKKVKKCISFLKDNGLLNVFSRNGKDSYYVLNIPYVSDKDVSHKRSSRSVAKNMGDCEPT